MNEEVSILQEGIIGQNNVQTLVQLRSREATFAGSTSLSTSWGQRHERMVLIFNYFF